MTARDYKQQERVKGERPALFPCLTNQDRASLVHHFARSVLLTWDWLTCLRGRGFMLRSCA